MPLFTRLLILSTCLAVSHACASTRYTSTWSSPEAKPVGSVQGQTVVALVMAKNPSTRRAGEDELVRQLNAMGAKGVAAYSLIGDDLSDENKAKAAIEKSGASAVVVMRPMGRQQEIVSTPTMYAGPSYGGFWGGYYGYGWGGAYPAQEISTNTIVSVETVVYSLKQNKILWAGQSETTNPSRVDSFVRELATSATKEMKKAGLL